ncbi:hypothetical protein TRFO_04204 [Tritrichomonas foetus]|uniref:Uncharacterized protein n=1 Tax=Tritrichomonas foetus TaxID=1144522 RepID=A0A1J4KGY9_9EUKA|nr:hypothetical protein TRFO_04204 [Tritrichomonas foetus]|eukprot:OHT10687.1 hypothetical protein TRFO_04204 [Tritrichomonas foetus]
MKFFHFNVGLHSMVWYLMFGPPMLYFTLFCIYFFEGRWAKYIPTISETGTLFPNTEIIAIFFVHIGLMTMYCFIITTMYIFEKFRPTNRFLIKFTWLCTKWTGIGMIGVGLSPMNVVNKLHFFFAGSGFATSILVETVQLYLSFSSVSLFCRIRRLIYLVIQYVALATIGLSSGTLPDRIHDTVNALSEYSLIGFLQAFLLTYRGELKHYDLSLISI